MTTEQRNTTTLDQTHRAILSLAMWVLPAIFVGEWTLEALDGDPTFAPRWWIYVTFFALTVLVLRRPRPNALSLLVPAVLFLAGGTVFEDLSGATVGVPDAPTTLALLVGLGIFAVAIAYERLIAAIATTTSAVAAVALSTGRHDGLSADDLLIRVVAPVLMVSLGAWVIWRLRTELARNAWRLAKLVGARDRLVAAVSHELRTPLTGIVGFAEELAANPDRFDSAEGGELIGVIAGQARDMSAIIDDLLVAARVETGDLEPDISTVDLRQEVDRVLATGIVADVAAEGRLQVLGDGVAALADPLRCRQIIRNLISNAKRHGGSLITVTVSQSDDACHVSVRDNGASLSPEETSLVFEPYYTANRGVRVEGSVGLGLPVSQRLARLMGGDVSCAVTDTGTTFRLDLPTAPAPSRIPSNH